MEVGFVMVVDINLIPVWGIEFELSWILCRDEVDFFVCCEGDESWLVTCMLAKNTFFQDECAKWLGFCVGSPFWLQCEGSNSTSFHCGDKIDLVVVWVVEIDLISLWGIEPDLISAYGSELTWFWCGGRAWLGFSLRIETNLVLIWGSKLTWLQCRDRNWLGFRVGVEKYLVFASRSKITWFQCVHKN